MDAPYDSAHPTKTTHPGSYPRPKCDPKKTIIFTTTSAAANPEITTDPSLVYRGSRPHRPPATLPKQPMQSPYSTPRTATVTQQQQQLQQQLQQQQRQQQQQQQQQQVQPPTTSAPTTATSTPFGSHPSPRVSRYPQHPHSQVRSVCSPAARFANPYAFGVHRATHTKH